MEDFILQEIEKYGADGVDFISDWDEPSPPLVYKTYTKQEWIDSNRSYPKTNRRYWKMINKQKVYLNSNPIKTKTYFFERNDFYD